MKKFWIIFSIVCVVAGAAMFFGCVAGLGWDFSRLDAERNTEISFRTGEDSLPEASEVRSVSVLLESTRLEIRREGSEFCFSGYESQYRDIVCEGKDGILTVREQRDVLSWFLPGGWNRGRLTSVLTLPEDFDGDLQIQCANIDIGLEDASFGTLSLATSNGSLSLSRCTVRETLTLRSSNGALLLEEVSAKEIFCSTTNGSVTLQSVRSDSGLETSSANGAVTWNDCQAQTVSVSTTNAPIQIRGTEAGTSFRAASTNNSLSLSDCRAPVYVLSTTNGSLRLSLLGIRSEYEIAVVVSGRTWAGNQTGSDPAKKLTASTTNGSVSLEFRESAE